MLPNVQTFTSSRPSSSRLVSSSTEMSQQIPSYQLNISNTSCTRLQRVNQATSIYIWSMKHSKIMTISRDDFKHKIIRCCVCIPFYSAVKGVSKTCNREFSSFSKLKHHLFHCENMFKRELMWAHKDEVPDISMLSRIREIGDLAILENEPVLRIEFNTITLTHHQNELRKYLIYFGCPCRDDTSGPRCDKKSIALANVHMFSHLSALERAHRRFFAFKATDEQITESDRNWSNLVAMANVKKKGRPYKNYPIGSAIAPKPIVDMTSLSNQSSTKQSSDHSSRIREFTAFPMAKQSIASSSVHHQPSPSALSDRKHLIYSTPTLRRSPLAKSSASSAKSSTFTSSSPVDSGSSSDGLNAYSTNRTVKLDNGSPDYDDACRGINLNSNQNTAQVQQVPAEKVKITRTMVIAGRTIEITYDA